VSDASYGFVPWARRGLSALANTAPTQNFLTLQVQVAVNTVAAQPVDVRLQGPGQVTGIDPRAIVRMEPHPDTASFEPNYFPCIEFATPDFPWLFTAALPAGDALRPWICLIVVREQPGVALVPRARALPLIQINDPAVPLDELPNLGQIAMWAHAQIVGDAATSADAVRGALDGPAAARVSRIICPRKLEPATSYIACLVPTTRVGVRAGISPELPVDDGDVAPAWDATVTAPLSLPVYAWWRFSTSDDGDFASLAQKLHPPQEPLHLGHGDMDVSAPGFGMPPFPGLTLGLEGALSSVETVPTEWPAGTQDAFTQALAAILTPAPGPIPIVSPPTYGQTASGSDLPGAGTPPLWLRELNFDPRSRAAAGMGTVIVRADQEELVASAWDQYEALRSANQVLRQLQLARVVSAATRTRQLGAVDGPGTLLQLTRPSHGRTRLDQSSPLTLGAQVASSRIASGALSAAFRRLARRGGPVGRALFSAGARSLIVERLNAPATAPGAVAVMAPRSVPAGSVLLDQVSAQTTTIDLTPAVVSRAGGWVVAAHSLAPNPPIPPIGGGHHGGIVLPPVIDFPPDKSAFVVMEQRFRAAASAVADYVSDKTAKIVDAPDRPPLATELVLVQSLTLTAVDPVVTLTARARARLELPTTGDPLRPRLGEPTFPRPMSRALTPQQLLPGVERVLQDTAALLVTNPTFVEAFMVGLNDEMRRELAWRQYPVDQRGTFFKNFWGVGAGTAPVDDIPPISTWDPARHLGDNATAHGEQVVLLLRGELLRRYPSTIISAVNAVPGPNNQRTLGTTELFPIFRGSIDPDMVFFGFALSAEAAVAGDGWYFVLAEHPTEPRFGLEPGRQPGPLTRWNDLSWADIGSGLAHNHIDLSAPPPSPPLEGAAWAANSAQQAFITFREPVRLAMHATILLG
jgi:hypothetical protein